MVVDVCLNPGCLWLSLPWPFRVWDQASHAKGRCPRCGGLIIVTPDPALLEHITRTDALSRPCLPKADLG
jgi:hypothetical protein